MKYALLLLFSQLGFASYSPQVILTDALSGKTAQVNAVNELETILSSDSNVCKESGGNLAFILSTLQAPLTVNGSLSISNFPSSQNVVVTNSPTVTVSSGSISLPTNASTATNQAIEISTLMSIFGNLPNTINGVRVDGSGVTQPVSLLSIPLAPNASKETGGNLESIDSKLHLGQQTSASSLGVVIASDQSPIPITGSITATNASTGLNGAAAPTSSTQIAGQDGLGDLTPISITASGAIKTDSSLTTQPVSAIALPLPLNAAQESGGNLASIFNRTTGILSNQSNGTQKSQQIDASGNVQPAGDTNTRGVHVQPGDGTNVQSYTALGESKVIVSPLTSASTVTVVQPTGANLHAHIDSGIINIEGGNSTAVKVDGSAIIQPVSGSLAVSNFPSSQTVNGSITANAGSGTFTVGQSTGTNLHAVVDNFPTTQPISGSVAISNFPATQAISGSVTANIGSTNGLALDSSISALSAKLGSLGQKLATGSAPVVLASDQSAVPIEGGNTNAVKVDGSGVTQPISAVSLPLPAGASTAANQLSGNLSLSSIDGKLTTTVNGLKVDNSAVTQPVSGTVVSNAGSGTFTVGQTTGTNLHTVVDSITSALPTGANNIGSLSNITGTISLPTGASTAVNQATEITSINQVDTDIVSFKSANHTDLTTVDTDLKGSQPRKLQDGSGNAITSQISGSQRALDIGVNVAGVQVDPRQIRALTSSDTATVVQPTGTNLHAVVDSGAITANIGTTNGLALDSTLSALSAKFSSLGQKTMASSAPVVLASDQSAIPVSQSGTFTVQQGSTPTAIANAWPIKLTDGTNTAAVKAASTAAVTSDQSAVVALSPNSPIPTGSNTIGALLANQSMNLNQVGASSITLGQKTAASSIPVVLPSDQLPPTSISTDVSGTFTTTFTSSTFDAKGFSSLNFYVNVTAASGTTPTLDVALQTSADGTLWQNRYDMKRISSIDSDDSFPIGIDGGKYRYVVTIGGTTPSFTISIGTRLNMLSPPESFAFNDYSAISLVTIGNTSPAHELDSCSNVSVLIIRGTGAGNAMVQFQGSNDGTNYAAIGSTTTIAAAPSNTGISVSNMAFRFYRVSVTAGVATGTADLKWACN